MQTTAPDPSAAFDLRDARDRQTQRAQMPRRMLRMTAASYAIDTLMLALLWVAGAGSGAAAWMVALGGSVIFLSFDHAFRTGRNDRFRDRYLTVPQLLASSSLLLAVAVSAPDVAMPLLSVLFIVFASAALRMSRRQTAATWAGISLAILAVVATADRPPALPSANLAQTLLSALWLCLVLGRCALVGLYGSSLRKALARRGRELATASGELHTLAMRDGLTGALNRRAIMEALEQALLADQPAGVSVAVILVDMDHFKAINDRFGHPAGDEVLRRFVIASARVLRGMDRLGRFGGEEFLLVLPGVTEGEPALSIAERVRGQVAGHEWGDIAPDLRVTVSLGVVQARPGESARVVLDRVDRALYRAKDDGRDCVRSDALAPQPR
jgi:diguanylate cyclase (GGDEF)-like protein